MIRNRLQWFTALCVLGFFVSLTAHASSVSLAWTASTDASVVGYKVYRNDQSGAGYLPLTASPIQMASYTDSAVVAGKSYSYEVTSVNSSGVESSPSNSVTANLACSYSISPRSASFTAAGGTGKISVTTTTACSWTASSSAAWVTVSPISGTGSGSVSFTVAANTTTSTRMSTVTVAGQSVSISQAAGTGGGGTTPQTLNFLPTDDAYVSQEEPTRNFGSASTLRVRYGRLTSYMRFNVTGVTGTVTKAVIRMYVIEDSAEGGKCFQVANTYRSSATAWVEGGITYNNAPTIGTTALCGLGSVKIGTWVEHDVTAAVKGNGVFSFAISNSVSDRAQFGSSEGSNKPVLVISTN